MNDFDIFKKYDSIRDEDEAFVTPPQKKSDFLVKIIFFNNIIALISLFTALAFVFKARPHEKTFFDSLVSHSLSDKWNYKLLGTTIYFAGASLLIGLINIYLIQFRNKRKNDDKGFISALIIIISISYLSFYAIYL